AGASIHRVRGYSLPASRTFPPLLNQAPYPEPEHGHARGRWIRSRLPAEGLGSRPLPRLPPLYTDGGTPGSSAGCIARRTSPRSGGSAASAGAVLKGDRDYSCTYL